MKNNFLPELFIPPDGLIRTPPPDKVKLYAKKFDAIGSFSRHAYDLDICTLYRQMEDLKERYHEFAGRPFQEYLRQVKDAIDYDLSFSKLDSEFYINHFYFVINPNHPSYFTYMGLFLMMSDPLLVVSKLEYHLKQFSIHDASGIDSETFLGKLEFTVCNAIRTARFPEDYHSKHDKIINWLYNKRAINQIRNEMNTKLDALILGINRISPEQKISNEIVHGKPGRKKNEGTEVSIVPNMVSVFITDLKEYFNENSHEALNKIISGKADPSLIVNFDGNANQLIDVFRIYVDAGFIKAEKRTVANWIFRHFMYKNDKKRGFVPFDNNAVERKIYSGNPLDKKKRIPLSSLPKSQSGYYSNKKKSSSDMSSDD